MEINLKEIPKEILLYAYLSLLTNLITTDARAKENYGSYLLDMFTNIVIGIESINERKENTKAFREYFGKKI